MAINRTVTALLLLFAGVMALLILRYDPWVYAGIIDNPLVSVPLAAALALAVGLSAVRQVPEPGRAVVLRDDRFHQLDPRGRVPLLPWRDRIAEVASLAEHELTHWPVTVYTADGGEHMVIFDLTWRLVPTASRPESQRERRILQMSDEQRQRIVQQAVERVVRGIARCATLPSLRDALTYPPCLDAIRDLVSAQLHDDALTVDRLHLQRVYAGDTPKEHGEAKAAPAASAAPLPAIAPAAAVAPATEPLTTHLPPPLSQPPRPVPRGIGPEQLGQIGPSAPLPGPM